MAEIMRATVTDKILQPEVVLWCFSGLTVGLRHGFTGVLSGHSFQGDL